MIRKTLYGVLLSVCVIMIAGCSENACDGIEIDGQCVSQNVLDENDLIVDDQNGCQSDSDCIIAHATSASCISVLLGTNFCVVNACEAGYEVDYINTRCVEQPPSSSFEGQCRSDSDCFIEHATSVSCIQSFDVPSYCMVNSCENGYLIDYSQTECFKDTTEVDPPDKPEDPPEDDWMVCKTDADCMSEGVAQATCNNEFDFAIVYCTVDECLPGYHYYDGGCEIDDTNNCGYHGNSCMAYEGVESATCDLDSDDYWGMSCTPVCKSGYHFVNDNYGKHCETDYDWRCGEEQLDCGDLPNVMHGVCKEGKCVAKDCHYGYVVVNGQCVDSTSNDCCGSACQKCDIQKGLTCQYGSCESICLMDELYCNETCVNIYEDPLNCGKCGNVCTTDGFENAETMACVDKQCEIGTCVKGMHLLSGVCVADDDENCGKLGNACAEGTHCELSECVCNTGTIDCNGHCVDTTSDPNHCGACGSTCGILGTCSDSQCTCGPFIQTCNGKCAQLENDSNNCGECGKKCSTGEFCFMGTCVNECDASGYVTLDFNEETIKAYCISDDVAYQNLVKAKGSAYPDSNQDNAYILMTNIDNQDKPITLKDGKFFGNYHTISGEMSHSNDDWDRTAIFNTVENSYIDGIISNIHADNGSMNSNNSVGGVVAKAVNSRISNCIAVNRVFGYYHVGGIAGYADGCSFNNCHYYGSLEASVYAGGIVGYLEKGTVDDSEAFGEIVNNSKEAGGIVGASDNSIIKNCTSDAFISGNKRTAAFDKGGIAGSINATTVEHCTSTGKVSHEGRYVGGLIGTASENSVIKDSVSSGDVYGNFEGIGGLVGYLLDSTIENCISTSKVSVGLSGYSAGGLVGTVYRGIIKDSSASGNIITNSSSIGGLAGTIDDNTTISNCYSSSKVSGYSKVGGLIGRIGENLSPGSCTIDTCYALGDVSGESEIGGLVGYAYVANGDDYEPHTIKDSYAKGKVTSTSFNSGGLVGEIYNTNILHSYSEGAVLGTYNTGGLVGKCSYSQISDCNASGDVSGISRVDSLLCSESTRECEIINSTGTGTVTVPDD